MAQQAGSHSEELERLRQDLRSCRLELAQRHRELEALLEERHEALRRCEEAEEQARLLSTHLAEHLADAASATTSAGSPRRLRRRVGLAGDSREDAEVALLQDCELMDGPWYLRQYPEVVTTGLSPALHYLRYGAEAGLDPGPRFSTEDYLRGHPELARTGENPLVHHLRGRSADDQSSLAQ